MSDPSLSAATAQRYLPGIAHERMAAGNCPECGQPAQGHRTDVRFWLPGPDCDLLVRGVEQRIEQYRRDQEGQ